ncbi:ATP-binding protein [Bacillus cereus group sp. MYBK15-3]|uniref:DNA polymerase III subunit n=1 Tax=unclassified Bacillus cereus group TaxID=2750818 RepID=UPI003F7AD55E
MSELSWTRKFRPKLMEEYIGNSTMKGKIARLLEVGKLPQMMLFKGDPGTGKTTMARLLAKALMCERPVNGKACGGCDTCTRMDEDYIQTGKSPRGISVYEYDITKMNKREDATNIVSRMQKRTLGDTKRVFILDEVQRATKEAQSSFLKITEEPIEGLYVILCTTDPQDLLDAFRSRLISFNVQKPTASEIAQRLVTICQLEGVDYTMEGLKLLADKSGRTPRDTLNRAEVIAASTGNLKRNTVQAELELISEKVFEDFIRICKTGKLHEVTTLTATMEEKNIGVVAFVDGLGDYVVQLMNIRASIRLDRYDEMQVKKMRDLIKGLTDSDIIKLLKVLKEYSGIKRSAGFLLYSLAVEVMTALKVEERAVNVTPEKASSRYKEVTKQVKAGNTNRKPAEATDADIESAFQGAKQVRR